MEIMGFFNETLVDKEGGQEGMKSKRKGESQPGGKRIMTES